MITSYKSIIFNLLLLLLSTTNVISQTIKDQTFSISDLRYERIEEEHGFIQNSIFSIQQDHNGYLYCCTPNGLFKYDGYSFTTYNNKIDDDNSLANNYVTDVDEDDKGRIWSVNPQGINIYDANKREFTRLDFPQFSSTPLKQIAIDKANNQIIWFSASSGIGVMRYSEESQEIVDIEYPILESVNSITQCKDGGVWVVTNRGVLSRYTYDKNDKLVIATPMANYNIQSVAEGNNGKLYAASRVAIFELTKRQNSNEYDITELYRFSKDYVNNSFKKYISIAPDGDIWCVAWKYGIVQIDATDNKKVQTYEIFHNNPDFKSAIFSSVKIDDSGVMWLGTFYEGLFKINLYQKRFLSLFDDSSQSHSNRFLTNCITGDDKGNIWVGTIFQGIHHYNLADKTRVKSNRIPIKSSTGDIYPVVYHNDRLWTTIDDEIIAIDVDENGETRKIHKIDNNGLHIDITSNLYIDPNGILWLMNFTSGGLYFLDTNKDIESIKLQTLKIVEPGKVPIISDRMSVVNMDSDGKLWIGTYSHGIYRLTLNNLKVTHVERLKLDQTMQGVDKNSSFGMYEDDHRNMWIGLFGGGVLKVGMDQFDTPERFKRYTTEDGLPDNAIYSIVPDNNGMLWISSDNGLSRFDPQSEEFKNYNHLDGIKNYNFRKWSAWQNNNGEIYFGGTKGITLFDPSQINDNALAPTIQITSLKVAEEDIVFENYICHSELSDSDDLETLHLKADQNSLMIEFSAIHFDNPDKIEYYYRLKGFNDTWSHTSTLGARFASYSYLEAGNYEFEVKAMTRDGVWSKGVTSIKIDIAAHWYATWWFKLIIFLLIIGLIYMLLTFQKRRIILQNEVEYERRQKEDTIEMNQSRLDFYTNISHEIKTPLTIMLGVIEGRIQRGVECIDGNDFNSLNRNVRRMLQLVTQLLDFRRAVAGHMPFNPIRSDIAQFIHDLVEPFYSLSTQRGVTFKCTTSSDSIIADFDPDKVDKIISNLLSNAFKYSSQNSVITVDLLRGVPDDAPSTNVSKLKHNESDYLTISVQDNGIGIPEADLENIFKRFFQSSIDLKLTDTDKGVGVGLSLVKLLVDLHDGFIYAKSEVDKGSIFKVVIPISQPDVKLLPNDKVDMALSQVVDNSRGNVNVELVDSNTIKRSDDGEVVFYNSVILIVEDNSDIRNFIRKSLDSDFKIIEAENGQIGLEKAIKYIPDLIITDVMMPEMDGLEMTDRIKNNKLTNHIPVIMLTVNDHIDNKIDGLKAGADSYITKPFNIGHLRVRIEKLLELRITLKEKYLMLSGDKQLSDLDINSDDKEFLAELEGILESNLSNANFSVSQLEEIMGYSRMQLYRKVKNITGLPAVEYLRNYRLKRSVDMMHTTRLSIREILYDVGFTSPSYYSKCFKARYDMTPKEFLQKIRE